MTCVLTKSDPFSRDIGAHLLFHTLYLRGIFFHQRKLRFKIETTYTRLSRRKKTKKKENNEEGGKKKKLANREIFFRTWCVSSKYVHSFVHHRCLVFCSYHFFFLRCSYCILVSYKRDSSFWSCSAKYNFYKLLRCDFAILLFENCIGIWIFKTLNVKLEFLQSVIHCIGTSQTIV